MIHPRFDYRDSTILERFNVSFHNRTVHHHLLVAAEAVLTRRYIVGPPTEPPHDSPDINIDDNKIMRDSAKILPCVGGG